MEKRQVQIDLRIQRNGFKKKMKLHCLLNRISQRDISAYIGITEQEYHNMMTGYQSSVQRRGIVSFDHFKEKIFEFLGTDEI